MENVPPEATHALAFVLDNEVVDIMLTDDRLAAIFLSNPIIIDVTGDEPRSINCTVGDKYNPETGTITPSFNKMDLISE